MNVLKSKSLDIEVNNPATKHGPNDHDYEKIFGALKDVARRLTAVEQHPRFRAQSRDPIGRLAPRVHTPADLHQGYAQLQHEIAQHKLHEAALT